ncbi:MAG TPA: hypothetical protein PKY30_13425 [Myxococcota bacterium]|nr:hypothetical protein [Myxococcota bacterium]
MPDPALYASVVSALVPLRKETGGNLRAADWNQLVAAVTALAQSLGGSDAGAAEGGMPAGLPAMEPEKPAAGAATLPDALLSLESRLSSLESSIAALPSQFAPDSSAEVALLRGRLETLTDIYPRLERAEVAARTPTQTALAMQEQQLRLQEGHASLPGAPTTSSTTCACSACGWRAARWPTRSPRRTRGWTRSWRGWKS